MKRIVLAAAFVTGLVLPVVAPASPDAPFGHACVAQNDVRFCPTAGDDQRVPSFDGVPLDVDVTLPAEGTGPFPTIVMLHGFPGSKASFESDSREGKLKDASTNPPLREAHTYHWNNVYYATEGYAVVNASSRGFGRSCGAPDSRTSPQCDRGWVHPVADQRFELHDVQHLIGLLVDEGVTDPNKIGLTGTSQGGGSTMQLAFLKDRVRNVDGTLSPWTSPAGKPLHVAAAYPRWGYEDLGYSLIPNGRALDFASSSKAQGLKPIGVPKISVLNALAAGGPAVGNIAPKGADPTADLFGWQEVVNAGEPYGSPASDIATQFATYKGVPGIPGDDVPPLLIQIGWTDPVFPALQAVRPYQRALASEAEAAIQVGDVGHFTGGNPLGQYMQFNNDGAGFFARHLKGQAGSPTFGNVTAYLQGCPKGSKGSGAIKRPSWLELARGSFALTRKSGSVKSNGGSDSSAAGADPLKAADRCTEVKPGSAKGTTVLTRTSPGFTLLGLPTVRAKIKTEGDFGQLDALLWEVLENGKQRIVDFGVYRLTKDQTGTIVFQLQGNGFKFAKGSKVKLELRGRTPDLFRPSNGKFSVSLSDVRVFLPTYDKPSKSKGIGKPRH